MCSLTLGVELTAKKKEAIWDAEDEDDGTRDDPDIVHTLHIQRVSIMWYFTECDN